MKRCLFLSTLFAILALSAIAVGAESAAPGYGMLLQERSPSSPQAEPLSDSPRTPESIDPQERPLFERPIEAEPAIPMPVDPIVPQPIPDPIFIPVPGPEFKDLAAGSLAVRFAFGNWMLEGTVENRGEAVLRNSRPVRLERFEGSWKAIRTVMVADLHPGAKAKVHADLPSQPKADTLFRLSVWGIDDRNANNAVSFKMPSTRSDLAALSLAKVMVGPIPHLRATVKNLGDDPSATRAFRFERRSGAVWTVIQSGSLTSLLSGAATTLEASIAGLPTAPEYRFVLAAPGDMNAVNDAKSYTVPVDDLAVMSFAKVGGELKARIRNAGTVAFAGGRSYKVERKIGVGPWTMLTSSGIASLAVGAEEHVSLIVAVAPPGTQYRISLTGADSHPANDTKSIP